MLMLYQMLQDSAVKVAKRLHKPRHPVQLAADIVERAIATVGEQYLQTQEHTLSWWQLSLLDVTAFLVLAAAAGVSFLVLTVQFAWWRGSPGMQSQQDLRRNSLDRRLRSVPSTKSMFYNGGCRYFPCIAEHA